MRWSELAGKDIINVEDAHRLGRVDGADLMLNEDGTIESLLAFARGRGARGDFAIPWEHVVKIGPEAMLVAVSPDGRAGATTTAGSSFAEDEAHLAQGGGWLRRRAARQVQREAANAHSHDRSVERTTSRGTRTARAPDVEAGHDLFVPRVRVITRKPGSSGGNVDRSGSRTASGAAAPPSEPSGGRASE